MSQSPKEKGTNKGLKEDMKISQEIPHPPQEEPEAMVLTRKSGKKVPENP